jgi:23S rRNA (uracil1939-C5)-methyltransferase
MDSMGQGVSKIGDKVSFIPKTLPGETGEAKVLSEKKGVRFLELLSLDESSPKRMQAQCPHFKDCPSCHFLHTDYKSELAFKAESLKRTLRTEKEIILHPAPDRLGYRNRIQLHYDKKRLGYLDGLNNKIVEVPECLIGEGPVLSKLRELYQDDNWKKIIDSKKGHIEIYANGEQVAVNINKPYSSGGFTQVYKEMNLKLKSLLKEKIIGKNLQILDLFGGNGNLTKDLSGNQVLIMDISPAPANLQNHQEYLQINLKKGFDQAQKTFDVLILDPPRAGFKDIDNFFRSVKCQDFFYVSCNPATLKRDLEKVSVIFDIKEIHLLDFFPSTYHFETLVYLSKH